MIIKSQNSTEGVVQKVIKLLPDLERKTVFKKEDIEEIVIQLDEDLRFFKESDPASKNSAPLILNSYVSFLSVVAYRVGNFLSRHAKKTGDFIFDIYARKISEWAKVKTGVEIHPNATIDCPFVIDHGYGTVIGETTVIGKQCYFLQGVVLGSIGIVGNPNEKRHPTIGNNVCLGAFVQVLGNISIGSYSLIGPGIKVTQSIPEHSTVIKQTDYIILRRSKEVNLFTL